MNSQSETSKKSQEVSTSETNILCIGEIKSGKSLFLKRLTKTPDFEHERTLLYKIFAKLINGRITYFHEVSEKYQVYLEIKYDGILYFVDVVDNFRINNKILHWMDLYAECSNQNPYNVPLYIIVTHLNGPNDSRVKKWKLSLFKQLQQIVDPEQIMLWQSMEQAQINISQFCRLISEGKAKSIKSTFKTFWKIYGLQETVKYIWANLEALIFKDNIKFIKNQQTDQDSQQDSNEQNQKLIKKNQNTTQPQQGKISNNQQQNKQQDGEITSDDKAQMVEQNVPSQKEKEKEEIFVYI